MSGSFENLNVPPTLVSFALCCEKADKLISPEFKKEGSSVFRARIRRMDNGMPDFSSVKNVYARVYEAIQAKKAYAAYAVGRGGVLAAVAKMALGNGIGARLVGDIGDFSEKAYGDIIIEGDGLDFERIGTTGGGAVSLNGEAVSLSALREAFEATLSRVYPLRKGIDGGVPDKLFEAKNYYVCRNKTARPRVLIPVFPGTNCEYDSAAAFCRAGANADIFVVRNLTAADIEHTTAQLALQLSQSQILMLPGGFSGGDEPDGSGKFIVALLCAPRVADAIYGLLGRDGLILGICSGFQALIKLGLVPYGEIRDMRPDSPTLTFNHIGRHVSVLVRTRVTSNASPWLFGAKPGDIHTVAVSHGEGRFVATEKEAAALLKAGQVATQYVDEAGRPTMGEGNPNGSLLAVEGLLSPDGRIFGKMAHSERFGAHTLKNVPGEKDQRIFESGVKYFS